MDDLYDAFYLVVGIFIGSLMAYIVQNDIYLINE